MRNKCLKFAAVAVATLGLAGSAYPIALNTPYSSILASSSAPGPDLTVYWEVSTSLNPGVYTYEYQILNPANDTTSVDFYNVSFNAILGVNVYRTGGGAFSDVSNGVNWLFAPILAGFSSPALNTGGVLYFTSPDLPTLGNANAQDSNPPSPWASLPGGQQVAVPNVPDGGTTVALFGLALAGVEGLRRILRKS